MGALVEAPGVGGVNRGRADAELTWGEESEGRIDLFRPQALSPAENMDAEHVGLIGLSATAPTVEPEHDAAAGAEIETSRGASAWRRRLSPRHRRAVRGFFAPEDEARATQPANDPSRGDE